MHIKNLEDKHLYQVSDQQEYARLTFPEWVGKGKQS